MFHSHIIEYLSEWWRNACFDWLKRWVDFCTNRKIIVTSCISTTLNFWNSPAFKRVRIIILSLSLSFFGWNLNLPKFFNETKLFSTNILRSEYMIFDFKILCSIIFWHTMNWSSSCLIVPVVLRFFFPRTLLPFLLLRLSYISGNLTRVLSVYVILHHFTSFYTVKLFPLFILLLLIFFCCLVHIYVHFIWYARLKKF